MFSDLIPGLPEKPAGGNNSLEGGFSFNI